MTLPPTAPATSSSQTAQRAALAAILVAAAILRLYNLRNSPGWFHDETVYVGESWNLIHGRFQRDTVEHTFLPRLPFFYLLVGPLELLFGRDIVWVRLVTALSGLAMTWFIYLCAREFGRSRPALIAAALFAIGPYAVLLNRWGFSYNLCGALGAASLYLALRHFRRPPEGWPLPAAALLSGLGLATEPVGVGRVLFILLLAWTTVRVLRALAASALALLPIAIYLTIMLGWHRRMFLEDAGVILGERVSGTADWFSLLSVFGRFLGDVGGYGLIGLIGLAFLPCARRRRILWLAFLLDVAPLLKVSAEDSGILYRMGMILLPPLFVGLGFLLDDVWRRIGDFVGGEARGAGQWVEGRLGRPLEKSERRLARAAGTAAAWVSLACLVAVLSFDSVRGAGHYFLNASRSFNEASLLNVEEAGSAASWINKRVQPGDLVIATHLDWMLHCQTVSPMLVQLAEGGEGSHVFFEALRGRFIRPSHRSDALFAVFHSASPKLASIYGVKPSMQPILDSWPKVFSSGTVSVYANPDRWAGDTPRRDGATP